MAAARLDHLERTGLRLDVTDGGPLDGEPVVLLHGWPGGAATWQRVAPLLHDAGCRTLVPSQRGYSPGARPRGRRPYALGELVADVVALLDAAELPRAHVVGHDWGGAVAWALAGTHPDRVGRLTVVSTPHPSAMRRAALTGTQALKSSYMALFQLPWLPERLLLARRGAMLRRALIRSGLPAEDAATYVAAQSEPGALTASLGWYRAIAFAPQGGGRITVPTTYLWSFDDVALGRKAAELTARHVAGPYRFQPVPGPHWLPEVAPDLVARTILAAPPDH